jgi:protein TonB
MRLPLAWLAGSVLLHALVVLSIPHSAEQSPPLPEILRVTIEKSDPPRVAPVPERPAPRPVSPSKPAQEKPRIDPPRDQPKARAPVSAPASPAREVLSLPPQSPSESQVPVPAPEKSVEQAREAAAVTQSPPKQDSLAAARPAPPRVTDAYVLDSPVRYPRTSERGRVTLKVLVSRDGRATNVSLEKPSGYANLDRHAADAVRRWRFAPARQGGETLEQWVTVNVDY